MGCGVMDWRSSELAQRPHGWDRGARASVCGPSSKSNTTLLHWTLTVSRLWRGQHFDGYEATIDRLLPLILTGLLQDYFPSQQVRCPAHCPTVRCEDALLRQSWNGAALCLSALTTLGGRQRLVGPGTGPTRSPTQYPKVAMDALDFDDMVVLD